MKRSKVVSFLVLVRNRPSAVTRESDGVFAAATWAWIQLKNGNVTWSFCHRTPAMGPLEKVKYN